MIPKTPYEKAMRIVINVYLMDSKTITQGGISGTVYQPEEHVNSWDDLGSVILRYTWNESKSDRESIRKEVHAIIERSSRDDRGEDDRDQLVG